MADLRAMLGVYIKKAPRHKPKSCDSVPRPQKQEYTEETVILKQSTERLIPHA
jgi:hypothetical protein